MNDQDAAKVAISRRAIGGEAPIVISEITSRCLYTGFFGTLDSARMKRIMDTIMEVVDRSDNDLLIVDLSNLEVINSLIAEQLKRLNKLLQLVGMEVVFCGIRPVVAQSMISADVDLENITVEKNLKRALDLVLKKQGFKIVPIHDTK